MKEMFYKVFFVFLFFSLLGSWFIWGLFCPFCIETDADEGSCDEFCETHSFHEHSNLHSGCESHHQDECHHCSRESVKFHTHQKYIFTLPDRSRVGENFLTATVLTGKAAAVFQFTEIGTAVVSAGAVNLSLEFLNFVIMIA